MNQTSLVALSMLIAATLGNSSGADTDNACCCMCGKKVCVLEVSREAEEISGFEVEAKEICIPGIKLPWEKCGTRRFGRVRKVCVLTEIREQKTVCKYDWSVKTICTNCCRRHGLEHGLHCAEVNQDEKLPFPYYAVELAAEQASAAEAKVIAPYRQLSVIEVVRPTSVDQSATATTDPERP